MGDSVIPVTPGEGLRLGAVEINGILIPKHIIEQVKSDPNYFTDELTLDASTMTQLSETSIPCSQLFVRSDSDNSGYIFICSDPLQPTKGYQLSEGESVPIVIDDVSKVYVYTIGSNQKVSYIGSGPDE